MSSGIKHRISDDVKNAMRSKDKERLSTLRMITAAIKQKEVDERADLDDGQVLAVLDKMAKQHRDSIEQYQKAGRDDLVAKETSELEVVKSYLPEQLSEAEIRQIIKETIQATGASRMQDMGKLMGQLKPRLQGRADMGKVSGLIKQALS
ncbi:MAG: GatB/YqeY domain-containing protein [Gammaproteobacteria bacterium]|nr:GatB/YqeY domain-containing protein [Gammaproteobacteria bacterium]NIO61695.1 GatB/YqeY domain-containing protein [Gammaproteobacteria bacterium]NIP49315.1 GatB/YqeY domain-containing protein [Gammaproteobacteria bacterium]NIQ10537.1 GatB/YqeY domain-containing protein [Gammaproteobacteria bacterium]NIQ18946.1 GatB/YqeY domain-containing protein [Gammaproteobacteria bacterium]